jgi:4-hydroxybenzoate polyprenyltransferase
MKLAPSKNPEKESKQFGTLALVCGIGSLFIWFLGVAGLAFGVRAAILSNRVKNKKYLTFSIVGIVLSLISIVYYYSVR